MNVCMDEQDTEQTQLHVSSISLASRQAGTEHAATCALPIGRTTSKTIAETKLAQTS